MYIWIILMLLCVFLDQITKYLVVIYMDLYESVEIIPGILRFTYIRNEGAAFGSFSDSRWIFMLLSSVAIVGILIYFFVKKPQSKLFCSALTLIAGGGVGNMIDRIRLGYVVDFIDFCAFPNIWKWNFNVADSFVCIGAGLLILWLILDMVRENKMLKQRAGDIDTAEQNNAENSGEPDVMKNLYDNCTIGDEDNGKSIDESVNCTQDVYQSGQSSGTDIGSESYCGDMNKATDSDVKSCGDKTSDDNGNEDAMREKDEDATDVSGHE